jgi:hypothetical protein
MDIEQLVFSRAHKVCLDDVPSAVLNASATVARQLDAVLMSVGFKCTGELLTALGRLDPGYAIDQAVKVLGWAREEAGAHRQHNAYFIDFPANVPDTHEFWARLLEQAVMAVVRDADEPQIRVLLGADGSVGLDLLSLPGYGTYQHTYEEMVARHLPFEALLSDRLTLVRLGGSVEAEGQALFTELAGSAVPLSGDRLAELRFLAYGYSPSGSLLTDIPVRENLAVINAQRARLGVAPKIGTVTDVLRVAAELSGSDVTLAKAPKFKSMPRQVRHALMFALEYLVHTDARKLEDVPPRAEMWKRLAERLHPHEFDQFPSARRVFEVARGETDVRSRASRVESEFHAGRPNEAGRQLAVAPGEFYRSLDRMLRYPADLGRRLSILTQAERLAPQVSGRVLLSVRQHFGNRLTPGGPRIFLGRGGRPWTTADTRAPLDPKAVVELCAIIDAEVTRRLPSNRLILADPAIAGAALPLSGKNQTEGLGVWPRGSVSKLEEGELLRFFFYWKQRARRTDFDLSVLFTNDFGPASQISYTNLRGGYGEHSGDITDPGPDGATEFINIRLASVPKGVTVIPQVYLFNGGAGSGGGEGFAEVEENFLGYMTLSPEQKGLPFEPRTVRMKTVVRGDHRAVMPVVFFRGDDGCWYAKWLHIGLSAQMSSWGGNRVEENKVTTESFARSFMAYQYLQVRYLTSLLSANNAVVSARDAWREQADEGNVTYIGIEAPEGLPAGSEVFTLGNLGGLIPA